MLRRHILAAVLGISVVNAAGCSSGSSGKGADGGSGASPGSGGAATSSGGAVSTAGSGGDGAGNATASGGSGSTDCRPACVINLLKDCAPSGTCITQTNAASFSVNICYSNGVKVLTTVDSNSGMTTLSILKPGGGVCATQIAGLDADGNAAFTLKDPSGATVATGTSDASGNETITCGGQTYNLASDCSAAGGMGTSAQCTEGACQ